MRHSASMYQWMVSTTISNLPWLNQTMQLCCKHAIINPNWANNKDQTYDGPVLAYYGTFTMILWNPWCLSCSDSSRWKEIHNSCLKRLTVTYMQPVQCHGHLPMEPIRGSPWAKTLSRYFSYHILSFTLLKQCTYELYFVSGCGFIHRRCSNDLLIYH